MTSHPRALLLALMLSIAPRGAAGDPSDPDEVKPKITLGGYVETYYQFNVRRPSNGITSLRGFDDRDRTFTLSNAALDVKGDRGPVSAHVILQVGSTGAAYYAAEPSDPVLWRNLQQASLAYTTSGKVVIDAGLFPSPIGPEVIPIKDNWNWSRSDLFYGLPFFHTGARVAVPLGGGWIGMVHAYSGWNSVVDNNRTPSVAVSAAYAGKRVTGQVLYFGGVERPTGAPEGRAWRSLLDAYATFAVSDQTSVMVHADAGVEPNDLGRSAWAAGAIYGKAQLVRQLYAAVRVDYFREWVPDGATPLFWPAAWVGSGTATLGYQPAPGLSIRLEARHDQAEGEVFAASHMQDTVTLGATAWF